MADDRITFELRGDASKFEAQLRRVKAMADQFTRDVRLRRKQLRRKQIGQRRVARQMRVRDRRKARRVRRRQAVR